MWVLIGIIVIVAVVLWWKGAFGFVNGNSGAFQAVFLTNGQVYFGKLANAKSQYPVLREVYYLQVTQPLQPKDQNTQTAPNLNTHSVAKKLQTQNKPTHTVRPSALRPVVFDFNSRWRVDEVEVNWIK